LRFGMLRSRQSRREGADEEKVTLRRIPCS
jgi:hypothetical protein